MVKISHCLPGFHTSKSGGAKKIIHPTAGRYPPMGCFFGTEPTQPEVGAFEVNNGLFAAKPRCLWMGRVSSISSEVKMMAWWLSLGRLDGSFFLFFWCLWWFDDVFLYYVSADLNNRHPLVAFFCEHVAKPWPEWGQESTNAECRNFQLFLLKLLGFYRFQHQHWWWFQLGLGCSKQKKAFEFYQWIFQDDVEPGEAVAYQLQKLLGCLMLPAACTSYVFWQRLVKRSGMLGMELTAKGKAPPQKSFDLKTKFTPNSGSSFVDPARPPFLQIRVRASSRERPWELCP